MPRLSSIVLGRPFVTGHGLAVAAAGQGCLFTLSIRFLPVGILIDALDARFVACLATHFWWFSLHAKDGRELVFSIRSCDRDGSAV